MQEGIDPQRLTRSRRARLAALAALAGGVLLAGCGGGSHDPTAASIGGATTPASTVSSASQATTAGSSTATGGGTTSSGSTAPDTGAPNALGFAKCMRANGVPNFPDPSAGGGFLFSTAGINPAAPAVQAARAKCQKFALTPPGAGGSSFSPDEKAHALAKLRKVAQCMRQHGISQFPDPMTTRPLNLSLGEYSEITDYEGLFLLFPATIDMESPAWERAATACGPLAESFNHPHH
jgi:hypothetical protein